MYHYNTLKFITAVQKEDVRGISSCLETIEPEVLTQDPLKMMDLIYARRRLRKIEKEDLTGLKETIDNLTQVKEEDFIDKYICRNAPQTSQVQD